MTSTAIAPAVTKPRTIDIHDNAINHCGIMGFQVVAIDGRPIQGAVRDTVLVMLRGARVRIAFDANNPGRWALHCHNLYHMQTGMMTEVRYDGIAAA